MSERSRLRWKCRRGLLELDLVLNAFLEKQFQTLSITEQKQFEALLEESDATLWAMISDSTHEIPAAHGPLLERLRTCSI